MSAWNCVWTERLAMTRAVATATAGMWPYWRRTRCSEHSSPFCTSSVEWLCTYKPQRTDPPSVYKQLKLLMTHTHNRFTALCPGLPGWAGTRKVEPIWILQKQQTVSGSGISWTICKSAPHSRQITTPAPHSRQITTPAPHHSVFYRPDALPAAQPTASKHCWWLYI